MTTHEPTDSASLATGPADYDHRYFQSGLGLRYDESEPHWSRFFGTIADELIQQLSPKSVLDVGCAKGFLVAAFAERGIDATGIDISDYAISEAVPGARERLKVHDIKEPFDGHWDLVTCIEVLEHMAPEDAQVAMDHITATADRILFTSTPHDFTESTHVNIHPVATWVSWFARRGFFRRTELDTSYLSPWAGIFERRQLTPADVAYLYEVEATPLREEVVVKRQALLQAERRIGELIKEHVPAPPPMPDPYAIDRVVTLIDQVIGLQAELAEAHYRGDQTVLHTLEKEAERRSELAELLELAELRARASEQRVGELLSSRSWRVGQLLLNPANRLAHFGRRDR